MATNSHVDGDQFLLFQANLHVEVTVKTGASANVIAKAQADAKELTEEAEELAIEAKRIKSKAMTKVEAAKMALQLAQGKAKVSCKRFLCLASFVC